MIRWLALATLLGCSAPGECRVYGDQESVSVPDHLNAILTVDRAFSTAELDAVRSAAAAWRDATNGRASLTLMPGDSSGEWAIDGVQVIGECPKCAGLTDLAPHRIELSASRISGITMLYAVTLHELGHFFGLGHSADESDLMFGCYVGNDEIAAEDIAEFDQLYSQTIRN